MATKGIFVWVGDYGKPQGHRTKCLVDNVTNDTALATLQTALEAHSEANLTQRTFAEITSLPGVAPGAGVNVDYRATYYFQHPTTLKTHSIMLPAPPAVDVYESDSGDRCTPAAVASVVAAISTATGIAYKAMYGIVEQKR